MIKQEKRKNRWLEKNGFTIVTKENLSELVNLSDELECHVSNKPGRYYAYCTYERWGCKFIYLIDNTFIKRDLHEIKLDYMVRINGEQPTSKLAHLGYGFRRFKRQCGALIKHGVNPWW
ncbi:hypothetical protein [Paenibacillus amylolyticus]|uniref:hypothetical protein n=1 Tax=Paenibacillus amylolyticus TaxID=1451 RepID=UPI003D99CD2D